MSRSEIIAGLKSGEIHLVFEKSAKHGDIWKTFGIPQEKKTSHSMYASCKECFYTAKVRDKNGRHIGTSNLRAHLTKCPKRQVQQQTSMNQFVTRTNRLRITSVEKNELKSLLVKHVVEGMHSFRSVEEDTLKALVQFGVRMGQRHPGCDIAIDDWIARRTVRRSVLDKYEQLEAKMHAALEYPLKHGYVSLTTDMWTASVRKRSYMDVSAMYLASEEATELSRIGLACHVFPEVAHNSANIKKELHAIMDKFNMSHDVPITSDSASVVLRALEDDTSFVCFCHRFNTCFSDAIQATVDEDDDLAQLMQDMRTLRTYISHTQGINHRLPITIKPACKTRAWEDVIQLFYAFHSSLDVLQEILEERNMVYKMPRNRNLISDVQAWITPLREIFRELETSKKPTLHMVLVAYFRVERYCSGVSEDQPQCLHVLAKNLWAAMEGKYWTSTAEMHMVAAFLHPNLKTMSMLSNSASSSAKWINATRRHIDQGVVQLAASIANNILTHDATDAGINGDDIGANAGEKRQRGAESDGEADAASLSMKKKSFFDDMFEVQEAVDEPVRQNDIVTELEAYKVFAVTKAYNNPLVFWQQHGAQFPLLKCVARRVFITQASSAESERHFSCAGNIVTDKRASLAGDMVQMLVLLKLNSCL